MKKALKGMKTIFGSSIVAAGGAQALAGIGGTSATHGAAGLANVTRFHPAIGSMVGAGMLIRATKKVLPKKLRRRRR